MSNSVLAVALDILVDLKKHKLTLAMQIGLSCICEREGCNSIFAERSLRWGGGGGTADPTSVN